jgi:hypothetical protein
MRAMHIDVPGLRLTVPPHHSGIPKTHIALRPLRASRLTTHPARVIWVWIRSSASAAAGADLGMQSDSLPKSPIVALATMR